MKNQKQTQDIHFSRQAERYPHLRELSITYEGQNEGISLRPPDLSTQGMFISTGLRFPEGAVLKLRFRLTRTGIEITTRSEVCYCLGGIGVGVKFLDLSPQSTQAIEKEIRLSRQPRGGIIGRIATQALSKPSPSYRGAASKLVSRAPGLPNDRINSDLRG
jgi:hypothetical protein